jgi:pullulanase/glycogen debranching enzyme
VARLDQALIEFAAAIAEFRRDHAAWFEGLFLTEDNAKWFGPDGAAPQWDDNGLNTLGLAISHPKTGRRLALVFSRTSKAAACKLPITETAWRKCDAFAAIWNSVAVYLEAVPPRSSKIRMPMPRDVDAAGEPDFVLGEHVVDKPGET